MLSFKNTTIVTVLLALGLLIYQSPLYCIIFLVIIYASVLFYGSYFIHSDFYIKAHCSGDAGLRQIAISFDDGPHATNTPIVLDILLQHQAPATFFCIGKNIVDNEALLQRIDAEGHIIGNHSFSHSVYIDFKTTKQWRKELLQTQQLIEDVIGKKTKWFRPPYGVTTPPLANAVKSVEYATIGWNLRSMDTVTKGKDQLLATLKAGVKPGAVVLLHDHCNSTLAVLSEFLVFVKSQGYNVVGLDKLLNLQPYA